MAVVLGILGVVTSCLGPAIEIGKLLAAPIGRRCSYLCCFRSNIKTLEDEAKVLDDATSDLQKRIDAATKNVCPIDAQVDTWLSKSTVMKNETNAISAEAPMVASGCLKLGKRYSLSKKAKKATIEIKKLVETSKFAEICHPPPIAAVAPVESGTTVYEFESRREIEEDIMKSLGDKNVNKIGICGMGGLGKTTMARKIMNRALEEELFGEIVMAVVSQPVDKLDIQQQIAKPLGLEFKDDNVLNSRANRLRERLKGKKRTLLVLDDVWKCLDIVELGIPCGDGCKVLITSCNNDVFKEMEIEKVCQVKILDEQEAWILFRGKAGACVDDALLNPIAKDVMRECNGLPLALSAVGLALKDEKDKTNWDGALSQLTKSNPTDLPNIIEKVYNHLKVSYDRLGDENKNAKSIFLLCCLFPEDYEIPLAHLAYFATGLHLFEDLGELQEVTWRTSALVKMLKTRGLLLDGGNEDHVRMHDVVRNVSTFIASKEGRVKCKECAWISSHVDGGARLNNAPKLKLLLMNDKAEEEQEMDSLIGGSTELNVLFIEQHRMLKSLPLIVSLTTLVLCDCASLESIAVVGEMKSLEILICHWCNSIKELPEQVRGLNRLKLLEIWRCPNLKRVAAGVISSMAALEELKIVDSFSNWKGWDIHEEEQGNEASLREIESLKKLRSLEIRVSDVALAAQPLHLSPKLAQFAVYFGNSVHGVYRGVPKRGYERRLSLNSENVRSNVIPFRRIIVSEGRHVNYGMDWRDFSRNEFLARSDCLHARGTNNQDFNLNLASAPRLRWLRLDEFGNKKNIASAAAALPLLEFLTLWNLRNLEEVWDDDDAPIPSNSLKELQLSNMRRLKRIGKCELSTARDFFLQLETIDIDNCEDMEHLLVLVPDEGDEDREEDIIKTVLIFPKLKILRLRQLPKLRSIINGGIESIQFPLLTEMAIDGNFRNLKWLTSRDDEEDVHYRDDDGSSHLFCRPKVSFGNITKLALDRNTESKNVWCNRVPMAFFTGLVELNISAYKKIRSLCSSKVPQHLVSLQKLKIALCEEMVKVIEDEEEEEDGKSPIKQHVPLFFPSLQHLELEDLPKLKSFCEWRCALELPALKILRISGCDEMKSFNAAAESVVIAPKLQTSGTSTMDLNSIVSNILRKQREEEEEERRRR